MEASKRSLDKRAKNLSGNEAVWLANEIDRRREKIKRRVQSLFYHCAYDFYTKSSTPNNGIARRIDDLETEFIILWRLYRKRDETDARKPNTSG